MKTKTLIWAAVLMAAGLSLLILAYWLGYQHASRSAAQSQVTGLSREQVLQMLPGKTWFKHWETTDRTRPTAFIVDRDGRISESGTTGYWNLELRWVLNQGGAHMFIPIDEYKLRGFFIPSGRQKGMFADKPQ